MREYGLSVPNRCVCKKKNQCGIWLDWADAYTLFEMHFDMK